ncbi:MAG: hypothetical protein A2Z42_04825 [Candidatus Woykebacteria bacterium RBG_19FT_COMBO_43_10]|uniref:SpoVT-AbrB domain-containing protein n=1 Tax=Candidatus Woykebacteria bacterium RBG_19FT_COMBO_43_10 TaxID=1802598 RepID=A0A1G1WG41_9BACT|nr:MAG: hypothetical protein A2Z42_04825 [Candidatus Woykebacteria bacterium RBG_19FT_COMBO_43_10]
MRQKIIKVGNSAAVTIPKKVLEENGFKIGDFVEVEIFPVGSKYPERLEFIKQIDKIIKNYRPALEELAKR